MSIELNHSFKYKPEPSKRFKIDFNRVRSLEDVARILGTLKIQISVPSKISKEQHEAIKEFLIEQ